MARLVFDIETLGEDFDSLDKTTQGVLTKWIEKESQSEVEYKAALEELKSRLGFSPLTGEVISIGILDYEENRGAVYFQAPDENIKDFEEGNVKFRKMAEKEMLQEFWRIAEHYDEFITFFGRGFDVPFLMIRSAIHKVIPSKNLMSNRYLSMQAHGATHVDLQDQLTFYGAMRRKGALHLFTRAFGIKSPKEGGITGDDVGRLFKEKRYLDIARYNMSDVSATKELYDYWQRYLRF